MKQKEIEYYLCYKCICMCENKSKRFRVRTEENIRGGVFKYLGAQCCIRETKEQFAISRTHAADIENNKGKDVISYLYFCAASERSCIEKGNTEIRLSLSFCENHQLIAP